MKSPKTTTKASGKADLALVDPIAADLELQRIAIEVFQDDEVIEKMLAQKPKPHISDFDLEDLEMFAESTLDRANGEITFHYPTPEAKTMYEPREQEYLDIARHNAPIAKRILALIAVKKSGVTSPVESVQTKRKRTIPKASKPVIPKTKAKAKAAR